MLSVPALPQKEVSRRTEEPTANWVVVVSVHVPVSYKHRESRGNKQHSSLASPSRGQSVFTSPSPRERDEEGERANCVTRSAVLSLSLSRTQEATEPPPPPRLSLSTYGQSHRGGLVGDQERDKHADTARDRRLARPAGCSGRRRRRGGDT